MFGRSVRNSTCLAAEIAFLRHGKSSHLHTAKILRLSMDLPLVIEIVDTEEKIKGFLPMIDGMMQGGLVTLEKERVIHYRANEPSWKTPTI